MRLAFGAWLVLIGIAFWLLETAYFGWNMYPGSEAESICDHIALFFMLLGVLCLKAESGHRKY